MNAESKRLTSPEITSLCAQYYQDTLAACVAKHVLATVTDAEIRSLFAFSLELSKKHIKLLTAIFHAKHFSCRTDLQMKMWICTHLRFLQILFG
ncbi:DUF3231 family protein [Priestia megaterium]|uniref:Uncharacterized protein n=1 Tax=Priestia megaterium (strain DSM 319 / IMG 1521) TaxID=592022 RepID=D5DBG4_PRIM3|nr:DUF3231 family protein [Priestia megaterium]ADF37946.1 hypothetical protein BMD_1085 [Priestia megaterium DSM 319]MED4217297.1 DUF3231 family protein [Priestia megaterium]WEZ37194.1 DUF3231 family protein [Priestia megaterium DSM 319]